MCPSCSPFEHSWTISYKTRRTVRHRDVVSPYTGASTCCARRSWSRRISSGRKCPPGRGSRKWKWTLVLLGERTGRCPAVTWSPLDPPHSVSASLNATLVICLNFHRNVYLHTSTPSTIDNTAISTQSFFSLRLSI